MSTSRISYSRLYRKQFQIARELAREFDQLVAVLAEQNIAEFSPEISELKKLGYKVVARLHKLRAAA
jgi:hypothetical protein